MAPPPTSPSPLLCDAVVVIEAHALGAWDVLIQRYRVALTGHIITECRHYRDAKTGVRTPIDLGPALTSGTIDRLDASAEETDTVRRALDRLTAAGLHAGELEALALLHCRGLDHQFCTAEEIATRALCHLGLFDRGSSFERVLRSIGLSKPLQPHFTEEVFRRWQERGRREWVERRDRPMPH